jgi:Sodium:dicarboxylate symporter family
MGWAAFQALCGLGLGLLLGAELGLGPVIGAVAQRGIGVYEVAAPVLIFAILAPSMLKLMRGERNDPRRFTLYAVAWFSALRAVVVVVAAVAVVLIYRLPLTGASDTGWHGAALWVPVDNRYLLTFVAAAATAWLLRHQRGWAIDAFLGLPDRIEAVGNVLTRFTGLFGMLIGIYIVSLPAVLAVGGPISHVVSFRWFSIGPDRPMTLYLTVTVLTALLCCGLHAGLVTWARMSVPGFRVRDYLTGYLSRVYPLIWCTGAESLAIPANLAALRRYAGDVPDAPRDLTAGLAATLNLNGSLICALVLIPAASMAIGHPLSVVGLLPCLPLIFMLGYAIPGIPGELVIFADPIAQALGLSDPERALFVMVFLSWQIGLPDSFRSAGSATDAVPATVLLTHAYRRRGLGTPASRTPRTRP